MARSFDVATEAPRFVLPLLTRQQIQALILDLDLDAREVIIRAVAELWQREMGEPDRDLAAEIDAIKLKIGMEPAAATRPSAPHGARQG